MTMASRGVSPIQRKARGSKMAKKMSSAGVSAPPKSEKTSMKISKRKSPLNSMSVGAAMAPQDPAAGLRSGMKKGGSCGSMKGYFKGGSVDGAIKKGHTKGKIC